MTAGSPIDRIIAVMAHLRHPEHGCAWDLAQSFETIAPYTIEEAYEVAESIARADMSELKDELGDLLLQVVFHARMAEEAGHFDFSDVADGIAEKMERRHPHIFAHTQDPGDRDLGSNWETIKAAERHTKAQTGALAGVAMALPALLRSEKLQKRAARTGFDWPDEEAAAAKLHEEIEEFREAASAGQRMEEAGDMLFSLVNWLRKCGISAEEALRAANHKFESRFASMEELARARGEEFPALDLEHQDALWTEIKGQK